MVQRIRDIVERFRSDERLEWLVVGSVVAMIILAILLRWILR